jgi:hypothetical protein
MKKRRKLLSTLLVMTLSSVLVAGSVKAESPVIHFEAVVTHCWEIQGWAPHTCDQEGYECWRTVRGEIVQSESALMNGVGVTEEILKIPQNPDEPMRIWVNPITCPIEGGFDVATYDPSSPPVDCPDAYDGAWAAPGESLLTPGGVKIMNRGFGIGDFEGWTIKSKGTTISYDSSPCPGNEVGGDPFVALKGIIKMP